MKNTHLNIGSDFVHALHSVIIIYNTRTLFKIRYQLLVVGHSRYTYHRNYSETAFKPPEFTKGLADPLIPLTFINFLCGHTSNKQNSHSLSFHWFCEQSLIYLECL